MYETGFRFFYLYDILYISSIRLFTFKNVYYTDYFLTNVVYQYNSFLELTVKYFKFMQDVLRKLRIRPKYLSFRNTSKYYTMTTRITSGFLVYSKYLLLGSNDVLPIFEFIN